MVRRGDIEQGLGAKVGMSNDQSTVCTGCCGAICFAFALFLIVLFSSIKVVEMNQQLVFKDSHGKWVKNGPFTQVVWPHQRMERREAVRLSARNYAVVKNERTGEKRHVAGPLLFFPEAYDIIESTEPVLSLQKNEYVRLVDKLVGSERVVRGPGILIPEALEAYEQGIQLCIIVGETNAIVVLNKTNGVKRLVTEKGMFAPAPYEEIVKEQEAILLEPDMYAVLKDHLTGQASNVLGPTLLKVGPYEEVLRTGSKIVLEKDNYIRLLDKHSGVERILRGPMNIVPEPYETFEDGLQKAPFLTTEVAALVLNKTSGQQRLEKTLGVFMPGSYETVLEVRRKIHVLPHQACIVRDAFGDVTVHSGAIQTAGSSNSFFLEPYTEMVEMSWSSYATPGVTEPVPKVKVTMIDLRAQKMFFNYEVRSSDNVKLRLEGTIFWQVKDLAKMISMTSDPSGDVSQHARSALIQGVSKVSLAVFMANFNNITMNAFATQSQDGFYSERGVELQSMELTGYDCVDAETAKILQQIIQETTNRINDLQKAASKNEVKTADMLADIALEQQRTELIRTRALNTQLESQSEGVADGTKLVQSALTFIDGLNMSLSNESSRVELYKMHEIMKARNTDTSNLASGKANLFLTPSDLNLKLAMGSGADL